MTPAQDAVVEAGPAALPFGDPAPFDPIALVEAGFASVRDEPPSSYPVDPAPFDPIALVEAGFAEALHDLPTEFDEPAPFAPIALLTAHTTPASADSAVTQDADASPGESPARFDAGPAPAGMVDPCQSDTAPWFGFAEPDAAPRFEPVALVEADGDGLMRTDGDLVEAVGAFAGFGVPDSPEENTCDEPMVAPAPWWQSPRGADRGTAAAASPDPGPMSETDEPAPFGPPPTREPEAASPGGVVDQSQASGGVSGPVPRQSEPVPPERHSSSYEPPRIPAPERRPLRQPASTSLFARCTGVVLVAAAALVVAVVVGAPSIIFGPPFAPVDPAIAPPVSEAELAAAVAALESQPLTGSAPSADSSSGAKSPPSPAAAAAAVKTSPATVTRAPASKPGDRNANAKRRNAARPAARPEPPRVQNEPAAVTPAPLAASSIAVPAQAVHAPAAAQARPAPAGPAYEATQVDARPQVESQVPARVPEHLRDRRFEEALVVRVLVSSGGRASDVRVLRGSRIDTSLDAAAVAAVKQWRFSAARRRGQAVDCWISVGVPFRSEGGGTDR